MRILFDSRLEKYKSPFGTVRTGEACVLNVYVPDSAEAIGVTLMVEDCDGRPYADFYLEKKGRQGAYNVWTVEFSLDRGLYFYWFRFWKENGSFRLFRQGRDTNMEAGDKWQVSFIPADFQTPSYAAGAVMYQILPDRFYKEGDCDLTYKLQPFYIHGSPEECPRYGPDPWGNWGNDFFGGNLAGIRKKLPYIQSLGTEIIYLNPIFMAFSNHRYDTANYKQVDPMLGTEADFAALCKAAHEMGMKIILDGVFSHTGNNSIYFDANHIFGNGAVSNPQSPYRDWYRFSRYPDQYGAWWGIKTLPEVEELTDSYLDYIIRDEDSVVAHWMKLGADGYRLDVADELPDRFIYLLKQRIRGINPDALLIGEVWEDASNKRAYGLSRRYFVDGELDSTMHYPWRNAIINYVLGRDDGSVLGESIMSIAENYPPQVLNCLMNLLSTHDTPRILTALGDDFRGRKEDKANRFLAPEARKLAKERLKQAAFLEFTLPGMASIFYGDEAGLEGFEDPFCRRCYPWGREDRELLEFYRKLGQLKKNTAALRTGKVLVTAAGGGRLQFLRSLAHETAEISVNLSRTNWKLPADGEILLSAGMNEEKLSPGGFCLRFMHGEEASCIE